MPHFRLAILAVLCLALLAGCQSRPKSTADVPKVFSPRYSIAVMPFTQPTDGSMLIMGQLPEDQGLIQPEQLVLLDQDLQDLLLSRKSERRLTFEKSMPSFMEVTTDIHSSSQPEALPLWADLARKSGCDFILVPQVIHWQDREGSAAGATVAAAVKLEFFLIRSDTGTVTKYSAFEDQQVGLTSNLLTLGDFMKRKGGWISARELAGEGMQGMLRELGLFY